MAAPADYHTCIYTYNILDTLLGVHDRKKGYGADVPGNQVRALAGRQEMGEKAAAGVKKRRFYTEESATNTKA